MARDELADALDLRNLGQHRKPIIVLNQDGYYDSLLAFVDHSIAEKFSKSEARKQSMVVEIVAEAFLTLEQVAATPVIKSARASIDPGSTRSGYFSAEASALASTRRCARASRRRRVCC